MPRKLRFYQRKGEKHRMPKQLTVSVDLDDVVVLPVSVPLDKISIGDVWIPPSDLPEFHSRIFEADTLPPSFSKSP